MNCYVVVLGADSSLSAVKLFGARGEASAAIDSPGKILVLDEGDLQKVPGNALVGIHNAACEAFGHKPVKRFSDRKAAAHRVWPMLLQVAVPATGTAASVVADSTAIKVKAKKVSGDKPVFRLGSLRAQFYDLLVAGTTIDELAKVYGGNKSLARAKVYGVSKACGRTVVRGEDGRLSFS